MRRCESNRTAATIINRPARLSFAANALTVLTEDNPPIPEQPM
jgi:hypothetical protein